MAEGEDVTAGESPLIFAPGDEPLEAESPDASDAPEAGELVLDEDRHPWLRGLTERQLAELAVDLTEFICRPAFGSRTKREIELRTFELLRRHRGDWARLGEIADDLAVSRSRARGLALDFEARRVGALPRGERRKLLRDFVEAWPRLLVDYDAGELRLVIDDPFMRDLLKNFAYANGILINHSFAPEIQKFTWSAYAQLVRALHFDRKFSNDDFLTLTSYLRKQILTAASHDALADTTLQKELAEVEELAKKVLQTKAEQRKEAIESFLGKFGPTLAGVVGRAAMPAP